MALRNIITGNDPALRKKSRSVTVFDKRLHTLLDDMTDTMRDANGVGLAAVQVGILRRAVTIDTGDAVVELVNPVITYKSDETVCASEGCLSFPGLAGQVERPQKVTVTAQNRHGDLIELTGEDLLSRAICHECDHLDGILYKDLTKTVYEIGADDEDEDEEDL